MSLITTLRAPGSGRRQADPEARLAAENQRLRDEIRRLRHQLEGAGHLIKGLRVQLDDADDKRHAEVAQVARVLGGQVRELLDERAVHAETARRLEVAVRANEANAGAVTVQTDVTALRAALADRYDDTPPPVPQYSPHRWVTGRTIRVVPLWASPLAAGPANIPAAAS